jgi:hypothetical protein
MGVKKFFVENAALLFSATSTIGAHIVQRAEALGSHPDFSMTLFKYTLFGASCVFLTGGCLDILNREDRRREQALLDNFLSPIE